MTKRELIKNLLNGKKMTSDEFTSPDKNYCIYDESKDNPFRFVNMINETNSEMSGVWKYTNWREVKENLNPFRLPTIEELSTLINYEKINPVCDLEDTYSDYYWSSTSYAGDSSQAWDIDFKSGNNSYSLKSNKDYVRCVREKDGKLEWSKSCTELMTWKEAIEYAKTLTDDDIYKG